MRHDPPSSLIRHLQVLRAVNEAVSRSLDLNEVLQRSLAALTHVTGHEISSLHLMSADGNSLLLRGDRGLSDELRRVNVELPMGEGLIGSVALTGQARRVDDASATDDLLPIARAAAIVRDLILFAEHRPPRRTRCQVAEQIREVVAFEEARLEGEGISVRTSLEPVPDIWADHNHLQEVLLHVIQNAQHAMVEAHAGGVLTISTTMVDSGVRIEVADDGPGIPSEHLPRIFNPFFTTKQPGDGRGLGLSVAHSIVTEHGGRIWAENRPQGGACISFTLPAL